MRKFLLPLLAGFSLSVTPQAKGLEDVVKFFSAQGVIIKRVDNSTFVSDKGLPYFKPGFPVAFFKATEVENPLTGKKTVVLVSDDGEGLVSLSYPSYSVVRVLKDNGVKVGDVVRLNYRSICFEGSDTAFQKLSQSLPVVKVNDISFCRWVIKETPKGYEVFLSGREVFFTQKQPTGYELNVAALTPKSLKVLIDAIELRDFNRLPTSADSVYFKGTRYVAVGFADGIAIFQVVDDSVEPLASVPSPVGKIVGVQLVPVNGSLYIIGNAFTSDAQPRAFIAKMVGTNPVLVAQDIPYYVAVLDKKNPQRTLVVQSFNGRFGEVHSASLEGDNLKIGRKIRMPEGFRACCASASEGMLAFIDDDGALKIFRREGESYKLEVSVPGDFGKSYTYISIPTVGGSLGKIYFPPRPVAANILGFEGFLVAKNHFRSILPISVSKFVKFTGGDLYFVIPTGKGKFVERKLGGFTFKDAVQSVAVNKEGDTFVVSGYTNPFLFIKGGKLYRVKFKYF